MEAIGPYRVVKKLGEGGMGAVYLAEDDRLHRRVALKVIASEVARDPMRRARFEREARTAAVLTHPNICAVHDVGETAEGDPYIAMEYIDGVSLRSRMASEGGSIDVRTAVEIAIEVADALAEAHSRRIVHRDIKPDNVMLTTGGRVKVVDFGLAKPDPSGDSAGFGDKSTTFRLTAAGAVMGTTHYMSPEQASGVEDIDGRSDLFSLGVVLYEMLTGSVPFAGNSVSDVLHKICVEDPPAIASLNANVPTELERIVSKCLAKQRQRRQQSAADLAVDLRHVRDLLATSTASGRAPAVESKRRWPLVVAVAAVLIIATAIIFVIRTRPRDRSAPAAGRTIESIAVLPLTNASGDRAQDYLADGITDELTSRLSSIQRLRVASRASVLVYRDSKLPLRDLGRELRVDALLNGSVTRAGRDVRVVLHLVDPTADRDLWSQTYVRGADDVFSLQSDLAADVAQQVRVTLSPVQRERVGRVPTRSPAAYEAYLHAIYKNQTSLEREQDADDVIRYAEQAVAADPSFADAYVTLADGCVAKLFQWKGEAREYDEKAFVAIEKALALDPSNAAAYVTRGQLRYNALHRFDIAGAIADFHKAIDLDYNSAVAHHALGADLTHAGFHEAAVEQLRIVLRLEPGNRGARFRLPRALWQSNRFEEALEEYRRFGVNNFEHAVTLGFLGKTDEAWSVVRESAAAPRASTTVDADDAAARAFLYALAHKRSEANEEIRKSFEGGGKNAHFHHAAVILAAACAELGDAPAAVRWLRLAASTGMPDYPLFRDNPSLRKLHGDPAFERFMSELKPSWELLASEVQRQ